MTPEPSEREQMARTLEGLAGLSTVLTAINSDTYRSALLAGAASLRSSAGLAAMRDALQALVDYETMPYCYLPPEKRNRDIRTLLADAEAALAAQKGDR